MRQSVHFRFKLRAPNSLLLLESCTYAYCLFHFEISIIQRFLPNIDKESVVVDCCESVHLFLFYFIYNYNDLTIIQKYG